MSRAELFAALASDLDQDLCAFVRLKRSRELQELLQTVPANQHGKLWTMVWNRPTVQAALQRMAPEGFAEDSDDEAQLLTQADGDVDGPGALVGRRLVKEVPQEEQLTQLDQDDDDEEQDGAMLRGRVVSYDTQTELFTVAYGDTSEELTAEETRSLVAAAEARAEEDAAAQFRGLAAARTLLQDVAHLTLCYLKATGPTRKEKAEGKVRKRKTPEALTDLVVSLHDLIMSLGRPADEELQNRIAKVCEQWFLDDRPERELVVAQLLPYLIFRATVRSDASAADVSRVYAVREALTLFDVGDESFETLRRLLLQLPTIPRILNCGTGHKLLAFVLTLDPGLVLDVHRAIKQQIPAAPKGLLAVYGQVYYRAWSNAEGQVLLKVEHDCIQDLMQAALLARTKSLFNALCRVLAVFHEQKQTKAGVDAMLLRLYDPLLWRYLNAANAQVRLQAGTILAEAFPLQDADHSAAEAEEQLRKQLAAMERLLDDEAPAVRAVAVHGACRVLGTFWQLIPFPAVKRIITRLVLDLAYDKAASSVRTAVLEGVTFLLDQRLAHPLLKGVLPNLRHCIHDTSQRVRKTMVELLIAVSRARTISFLKVVPLKHLLERLSLDADKPAIAGKLTKLLLPSYLPATSKGVSSSRRLARAVALVRRHPGAARAFFAHVRTHTSLQEVCKLVVHLFHCVQACVATADDEDDGGATTTKRKKKSNAKALVPSAVIGRRIRKVFSGYGRVEGVVESYDAETSRYTVTFDDAEMGPEDLTAAALAPLLMSKDGEDEEKDAGDDDSAGDMPPPPPRPSRKRSSAEEEGEDAGGEAPLRASDVAALAAILDCVGVLWASVFPEIQPPTSSGASYVITKRRGGKKRHGKSGGLTRAQTQARDFLVEHLAGEHISGLLTFFQSALSPRDQDDDEEDDDGDGRDAADLAQARAGLYRLASFMGPDQVSGLGVETELLPKLLACSTRTDQGEGNSDASESFGPLLDLACAWGQEELLLRLVAGSLRAVLLGDVDEDDGVDSTAGKGKKGRKRPKAGSGRGRGKKKTTTKKTKEGKGRDSIPPMLALRLLDAMLQQGGQGQTSGGVVGGSVAPTAAAYERALTGQAAEELLDALACALPAIEGVVRTRLGLGLKLGGARGVPSTAGEDAGEYDATLLLALQLYGRLSLHRHAALNDDAALIESKSAGAAAGGSASDSLAPAGVKRLMRWAAEDICGLLFEQEDEVASGAVAASKDVPPSPQAASPPRSRRRKRAGPDHTPTHLHVRSSGGHDVDVAAGVRLVFRASAVAAALAAQCATMRMHAGGTESAVAGWIPLLSWRDDNVAAKESEAAAPALRRALFSCVMRQTVAVGKQSREVPEAADASHELVNALLDALHDLTAANAAWPELYGSDASAVPVPATTDARKSFRALLSAHSKSRSLPSLMPILLHSLVATSDGNRGGDADEEEEFGFEELSANASASAAAAATPRPSRTSSYRIPTSSVSLHLSRLGQSIVDAVSAHEEARQVMLANLAEAIDWQSAQTTQQQEEDGGDDQGEEGRTAADTRAQRRAEIARMLCLVSLFLSSQCPGSSNAAGAGKQKKDKAAATAMVTVPPPLLATLRQTLDVSVLANFKNVDIEEDDDDDGGDDMDMGGRSSSSSSSSKKTHINKTSEEDREEAAVMGIARQLSADLAALSMGQTPRR